MKYLNRILLVALVITLATSCDNEDNLFEGDPIVIPGISYSNVPASATLLERDTTYTITVTLDEATTVDISVPITQTAGDAVWGEDFEAPSSVTIDARQTTATFSLTLINEDVVELAEQVTLSIGTGGANVTSSVEVSFTINNDDFEASAAFNCDLNVDYDIYVINGDGSSIIGFDAASSACPEVFALSAADMPDGTYEIEVELYGVGDAEATDELPVTITFGASTEAPLVLNTLAADMLTGADEDATYVVGTIESANGVFTLKDAAGTVVGTL